MHKAAIAAAAVLFIFSCAGLAAELQTEPVAFTTSDGVSISAFFVPGKTDSAPAVILLHMLSRSKEDWKPVLADYLVPRTPYAYLAIDLRGHGESTVQEGRAISWKDFGPEQFNAMAQDVAAAVEYLKKRSGVDADRIAIVGASIGANVALRYAANHPDIDATALLSPGISYRGVNAEDAMKKYGNRPVFVASAREDKDAAEGLAMVNALATGAKTVHVYAGNVHGTNMFGVYPLGGQLVDFLKTSLGS